MIFFRCIFAFELFIFYIFFNHAFSDSKLILFVVFDRSWKTEEEGVTHSGFVGRQNRRHPAIRFGCHWILRTEGASARQVGSPHRRSVGLPEVRRLYRRIRQDRRHLEHRQRR